ncbi:MULTISPECIES: glutamate racemase [Nitrincola]|uniref:Glutamate racemase n=1 Tax=Nitrincola nitratireducens TaxID=1229521 RepID=W9VEC6_9GAMM|nr:MULTISPECIES: glutamate racemase [Nitrincola]EXJ09065.1 Glutamate racemase 1 [Nitrincola nitratireducens]
MENSSVGVSKSIGLFDSGVGGLTVLNEVRKCLPNENLVYLGDTARVPYGTKSVASISKYAEQAVRALESYDIKALVVACNTASAAALDVLRNSRPDLPIIGVIDPGAQAAVSVSQKCHIGVIATESTISNQAYQKAILSIRPDASIKAAACSLFVALAEEGWHEGELVEGIVKKSLESLFVHDPEQEGIDTLVLGCTHFPSLRGAIQNVVGPKVRLVDSATTAAEALCNALDGLGLLNPTSRNGKVIFLVTDGPERFARVAKNFYSELIMPEDVTLIDIQHFGFN